MGKKPVPKEGVIFMQKKIRFALFILLLMVLLLPLTSHAAIVGHFTKVQGDVDLLKAGKLPAIRVKVRDGVEPGDIVRTKTKARAELTMVDNSVIVLSPQSRLAVADYAYDASNGNRHAVIRLFRGLVHTVVSHIVKTEQPNFIMETHTATIGIRGTNFYTLLAPGFTSIYLVQGTLGIRSNLSKLPALLLLHSMQFTQVPLGKQPFLAQPLTPAMLKTLERLMHTGLVAGGLLGPQGPTAPGTGQFQLPLGAPSTPGQQYQREYIPPVLQPQHQQPAPTPSPVPSSTPPYVPPPA
jgi:hypothetical protein